MNRNVERLYNGVIKENPTFVLMLGMCPTLAVTTSLVNGAGMGLTTTLVLVMSNGMISALRNFIPDKVRVPSFIVVVASFVTLVRFFLEAYLPSLNDSLGIYIPLIVVNCIILGRAESYASKNPVVPSLFDGLGMGLGFTIGLSVLGAFRELLGSGTVLGVRLIPEQYNITLFVLAPGAFFVLACLVAIMNKVRKGRGKPPVSISCDSRNCAMCGGCQGMTQAVKTAPAPKAKGTGSAGKTGTATQSSAGTGAASDAIKSGKTPGVSGSQPLSAGKKEKEAEQGGEDRSGEPHPELLSSQPRKSTSSVDHGAESTREAGESENSPLQAAKNIAGDLEELGQNKTSEAQDKGQEASDSGSKIERLRPQKRMTESPDMTEISLNGEKIIPMQRPEAPAMTMKVSSIRQPETGEKPLGIQVIDVNKKTTSNKEASNKKGGK